MSTDQTDPEAETERTEMEPAETEAEATEADEAGTPEPEPAAPSPGERRRREKFARLADERAEDDAERSAAEAARVAEESILLKVYRYDPDVPGKTDPRYDHFHVPYTQGMTVLDALIYARDEFDASLTFRHSCRQAVCGSDALFINGRQRLACKTQIADVGDPVQVEPLPHADVVKDLVVDMEHFYDQMAAVEPYFQTDEYPEGELEEQRQSRENREKIKMSTRCIWCGACMSSCNIAAGDNEYLGPAALNKAYRFAMDEREGGDMTQRRLEMLDEEHGVWRCQTQFSCTEVCPKDIPLTEHIQELKREAIKQNLRFW